MEQRGNDILRSEGVRGILRSELPWFVRYGSGLVLLAVICCFTGALFISTPFVYDAVCNSVREDCINLDLPAGKQNIYGGDYIELLSPSTEKIRCHIAASYADSKGLHLKIKPLAGQPKCDIPPNTQCRIVERKPLYEKWFYSGD